MTRTINFHDSIDNGVLFSEVCANLLRDNKGLIKEIVTSDPYGAVTKSGLVLAATETNVKSLAQVLHNFRICLSVCAEIPLLYDMSHYIPEDFIFGDISLPKLLYHKFQVQEVQRRKQRRRAASVGRSNHGGHTQREYARRSRSHSPMPSHFIEGQSNSRRVIQRSSRSTSSCIPPAGLKFRQMNNISYVGKEHSVQFANTGTSEQQQERVPSSNEQNTRGRIRALSAQPSFVTHTRKELASRSNIGEKVSSRSKSASPSASRKLRVSFSLPIKAKTSGAHSVSASVQQVRGRSTAPVRRRGMTNSNHRHQEYGHLSPSSSSSGSGSADTSPFPGTECEHQDSMTSSQLFASVVEAAEQLAPSKPSAHRNNKGRVTNIVTTSTGRFRSKSPPARSHVGSSVPILADVGPTPYDTDILNPKGMVDPHAYQLHKAVTGLNKVDRHKRSYTDYLPHKSPSYDPSERKGWWTPPKLTQMEKMTASKDTFPMITSAQQLAVRQWLISLGLVIKDGEGGLVTRIDGGSRSSTPDTSLYDDRLRNGEMLCDLFMLLERNASVHAQLARLVHRKPPMTIKKATENIERACWLFRLKKCPPIPLKYLTHSEDILKGNRAVLWGLLWEILQATPIYSMDTSKSQAFGGFTSLSPGAGTDAACSGENYSNTQSQSSLHDDNFSPVSVVANSLLTADLYNANSSGSGPHSQLSSRFMINGNSGRTHDKVPLLPYTPEGRRQLDQSLVQWLYDKEVIIQPIVGYLTPIPVSLLALEGPIRDGTLLCKLTECVLSPDDAIPKKNRQCKNSFRYSGAAGGTSWNVCRGWNKSPQSYTQCIANLRKCLDCLRNVNNNAGASTGGCISSSTAGTGAGFFTTSKSIVYMSPRYLHGGMEEDIVRGDWNAILGLLEDIHRFDDRQPPRTEYPTMSSNNPTELPYLGSTYEKHVELQKRELNPAGGQLFDFFAPPAASEEERAKTEDSMDARGGVHLTAEREQAARVETAMKGTSSIFDGAICGSVSDLFPKSAVSSDHSNFDPGETRANGAGRPPLVVSDHSTNPFFRDLPQTLASKLGTLKSSSHASDTELIPDLNYIGGAYDGTGLCGHPPELIPQQVHQAQMLRPNQGESSYSDRDYVQQDFTGPTAIANANSSPLKLKVQVQTGRKLHSQHTPAEHAAYNYSFANTMENGAQINTGAGNWFFGTPQKETRRAPLNDVYDDSHSVHSSGGVEGHTPTSIETPEHISSAEPAYRQHKSASSKKLCFVGMESKENCGNGNNNNLDCTDSKLPLKKLQRLVPKSTVSLQMGAVPATAPAAVIKRSSSKSPIQGLIFQKHYRDAAAIAQWLESKFKLTFIPPFHAPVISDADVGNKDELIATLYGRHIYESLSRLHDGVLLCKLCQQQYHFDSIPGVTHAPKTRAHKLQNLRKALGIILANNKRIPASQILSKEDDIIEGNCTVILELLLMLKKIL